MFINDITAATKNISLLFADDLKIFSSVKSIQDCHALQLDLNMIYKWCNENGMELNIDKCYVLKIESRKDYRDFMYSVNNIYARVKFCVVDLGITIDDNIDFRLHIQDIVKRAYKMLGFVTRTLSNFTSIRSHTAVYGAYVRSILEYLTPIWNPNYSVHIQALERVQRKYTRLLNYKLQFEKESYPMRLVRYGLASLEERRILADEITLYKLLNFIIDSDLRNACKFNNNPYDTRFPLTFKLLPYRTNFRNNSPVIRFQAHHNLYFNNQDLFVGSLAVFVKQISKSLNH